MLKSILAAAALITALSFSVAPASAWGYHHHHHGCWHCGWHHHHRHW